MWERRPIQILVAVFICLIPAIPLLSLQWRPPTMDWENHTWLITYYKEHLLHHGRFPEMVHTHQAVGVPLPVFYGVHFYRVLALFSLPFGRTDWGLRLFLFLLIVAKFWLIRSLCEKTFRDSKMAFGIAALGVWEIYAMTNMFHRAAVTEIVAGSFFFCAVLCFLHGSFSPARSRWIAAGAVLMTLSAGSHPTTAMVGTVAMVFIVMAVAVSLPAGRRYAMAFLGVVLAAEILGLLPWIYALKSFQGALYIMRPSVPLYEIVPDLHKLWLRLMPFPFDIRSSGKGLEDLRAVSTPYLDTQISVGLLIALTGLLMLVLRKTRKVPLAFALTFSGFLLLLFLSSGYDLWSKLPTGALNTVQFPYRLVAFCNVFLLVSFFLLALRSGSLAVSRPFRILLLCCVAVSAFGVALKVPRSRLVMVEDYQLRPYRWETNAAYVLALPRYFYGLNDYSTPKLYQASTVVSDKLPYAQFRVDMEENWGMPLPLKRTYEREERALVTSLAFPWNVIYVDDKRFDASNTEVPSNFPVLTYTPGAHQTRYSFEPPAIWRNLKRFSDAFVILLCVSVPLFWWKDRRKER